MANNRNTYQQVQTVSVSRDKLIEIASEPEYGKKDLKVFMILLSQLDGYNIPNKYNKNHKDPMNYKKIDKNKIADLLSLSKKEVSKVIDKLYDNGIIEKSDTDTIKNGYRFTF